MSRQPWTSRSGRFMLVGMVRASYPYFLANQPQMPNQDLAVYDKYTGHIFAHVAQASAQEVEQAIAAAWKAQEEMARWPADARRDVLYQCATKIQAQSEAFAQILCREVGKPIRDSRTEVMRLVETFRLASEEAVRLGGEVINMQISPRSRAYTGMWKRVPGGPCSFVSPFNFPLNLAAHKIAPALAVGCPFVLKPASLTPVSALMLGEILAEVDLPQGAFSILPCSRKNAEALITDERIKLLSFTGSPQVGWALKAQAGKKKVVLELGGNAACIVDQDADVKDACERLVFGAFYQSGQSCIKTQRVLIHRSLYADVKDRLIQQTKALVVGHPQHEETMIGPMISEAAADRLYTWVQQALNQGARLLCGGQRQGALFEATWLENVRSDAAIWNKEAFGPVGVLSCFDDFEEALLEVNRSEFGLQAGVFTQNIDKIQRAWDTLEVGGVLINEVPSFRSDHMPYGGVKNSGLGREGVRFAMEAMTEMRLLVLRNPRLA